jgi:hypothetical protein
MPVDVIDTCTFASGSVISRLTVCGRPGSTMAKP